MLSYLCKKVTMLEDKSRNFHAEFEKETNRIDNYASEQITNEFSTVPLAIQNEDRKRLHQAFVRVNIELRNQFRQSYIELRDANAKLE
jgi:hypothetical protein